MVNYKHNSLFGIYDIYVVSYLLLIRVQQQTAMSWPSIPRLHGPGHRVLPHLSIAHHNLADVLDAEVIYSSIISPHTVETGYEITFSNACI